MGLTTGAGAASTFLLAACLREGVGVRRRVRALTDFPVKAGRRVVCCPGAILFVSKTPKYERQTGQQTWRLELNSQFALSCHWSILLRPKIPICKHRLFRRHRHPHSPQHVVVERNLERGLWKGL